MCRRFVDPDGTIQGLPSGIEIAHLFGSLACNCHTICDEEEREIGTSFNDPDEIIERLD